VPHNVLYIIKITSDYIWRGKKLTELALTELKSGGLLKGLTHVGETRNVYRIVVRKPESK
jgi:hypothetical protein